MEKSYSGNKAAARMGFTPYTIHFTPATVTKYWLFKNSSYIVSATLFITWDLVTWLNNAYYIL